ncbi:unnamed protein product [Caenorhabditis angaria]|uniref:Major facilitator superfamily (MFS) profile domain-containing protein n=1 Tax=Caenorhabditis angaria TaxID=860376 RepID=A0A9P1IYI8_9PELO|nr:unnamed protein product [Caenorhabditis angaria]
MEEERLTPYLLFCISTIAIASFQDGFQIGCINAPGPLIIEFIKDSHFSLFETILTKETADIIWSVAVSMFSVGGMLGSLVSGILADKFGRRSTLLYNNIIALIAASLLTTSKYLNLYPLIVIGRFCVGLNCGITSGLVPMYLTELAPANLRGKCGSFHQLNISIAIVFSQALGLPYIFGTPERWPLIFGFIAIPAILQSFLILFCAESPKFLISHKHNRGGARRALVRLRSHENVDEELNNMITEAKKPHTDVSFLTLFQSPNLWPMIVSICMMMSQQFSGISSVTFYSTLIFKRNGFTGNWPLYATLSFGCAKLVTTVICLFMIDHPRFGRKPLHLFGLIAMFFCSILIVITLTLTNDGYAWASYANIFCILMFVCFFAFGPGPIPWFFTSEVFDSTLRSKAASVSATTNWLSNWIVGLTFLPINNIIHQYAFLMFTCALAFFIFFTWKFVPETKGKTPAEIQKEMCKNK